MKEKEGSAVTGSFYNGDHSVAGLVVAMVYTGRPGLSYPGRPSFSAALAHGAETRCRGTIASDLPDRTWGV